MERPTSAKASGALRKGDAEELRDDGRVGTVDLTHWYTPLGRATASLVRRVGTYLGDRGALILVLAIGAIIAFGLSFVASRIYDAITESDGVAGLDRPVLEAMIHLRTPALNGIAGSIAYVAGPIGMPILAALAIAILALHRKSWTPVILIASAGAGSVLMTIRQRAGRTGKEGPLRSGRRPRSPHFGGLRRPALPTIVSAQDV